MCGSYYQPLITTVCYYYPYIIQPKMRLHPYVEKQEQWACFQLMYIHVTGLMPCVMPVVWEGSHLGRQTGNSMTFAFFILWWSVLSPPRLLLPTSRCLVKEPCWATFNLTLWRCCLETGQAVCGKSNWHVCNCVCLCPTLYPARWISAWPNCKPPIVLLTFPGHCVWKWEGQNKWRGRRQCDGAAFWCMWVS